MRNSSSSSSYELDRTESASASRIAADAPNRPTSISISNSMQYYVQEYANHYIAVLAGNVSDTERGNDGVVHGALHLKLRIFENEIGSAKTAKSGTNNSKKKIAPSPALDRIRLRHRRSSSSPTSWRRSERHRSRCQRSTPMSTTTMRDRMRARRADVRDGAAQRRSRGRCHASARSVPVRVRVRGVVVVVVAIDFIDNNVEMIGALRARSCPRWRAAAGAAARSRAPSASRSCAIGTTTTTTTRDDKRDERVFDSGCSCTRICERAYVDVCAPPELNAITF
jgi:hypothetical protein